MKSLRTTAGSFVAAVALVLTVAPAATVAGLQPQLIAAQANSQQTLQPRTDQHMLTASSSKLGQIQGGISQGHVSPTKPKEFPPPVRELTKEERERILQGI
jgi:hypothetical protein